MSLCEPCAADYNRWLDYRPDYPVGLVSIGINTPRAVAESRHLCAEDTRRTIRNQLDLITAICKRDHRPQA